MEDCIFCKIVKGDIPTNKVYEDENVIAFLDIGPCTDKGGHTLIIPKKHYKDISSIPEDVLHKVISIVKKIGSAILKKAEGINILQNNGHIVSEVDHFHFHIMPRYKDDDVNITWTPKKYIEGEIEKVQEEIKKLINEA